MNDTTFFRGENPLRADKLNTAFSERVARGGDTMQGMLRLAADPVVAFDAATKQYVDRILSMGAHLATVVVADAPPPGAPDSTLWWDSKNSGLYVRYNDGNSTQWVIAENQVPSAGASSGAHNVRDYGATGDGGHDDAPAFAAALAAVTNGGKVIVPTGYYNLASPLSVSITGTVTFEGAGSGNTILSFSGVGDGLTFSLPSNQNVHVRGFTFIRAFAGATYANSGLVVATPGSGVALHYGQTSFEDLVFIGGSYFWQNQIVLSNCQNTTFEHIYGVLPNADGTGAGATGILIAGQSASSYLTEARFNDVGFQGGHVGLQINTWVQGVYVVNCSFGGNDYSIRWSGVSGHADLALVIANCHFNSGTRGVLAYSAEGVQITNTYNLHFSIPSNDGIYAAFELYNMDGGLVSNNNIYLNGASAAGTEYGIRIEGGNSSIVHGNRIDNPKTAGILLDGGVINTVVSGTLGTNIGAGIPLIQDTTGNISNQKYGTLYNGTPDITMDANNDVHVINNLYVPNTIVMAVPQILVAAGTYMQRVPASGNWVWLDGGNTNFTIQPDGHIIARTHITATGGYVDALAHQVSGTQVVGPRIAGWGTPTGGARTASFNGASATLPQTSAVLAQLILDLKTHGLLGA